MWQASRHKRNGKNMKFNLRDVLKVPNILSIVRILLIPVFVTVFLRENDNRGDSAGGYIAAAVIVIISGLTDAADGFIARHFNMITDLGKVLDPVADKLTQGAVVLCLFARYNNIWYFVAGLLSIILVKELIMLILGVFFLKKGQDLGGAKWFGKLATIIFYIAVIVLIGSPVMGDAQAIAIIMVVAAFMILSFVLYMREYFRMWKERKFNDKS